MSGFATNKHGSIVITAGALSYTFADDIGDFQVGGLEEGNAETVTVRARRSIVGLEFGEQREQEGSFTVQMRRESLTHPGSGRPLDAILKNGSLAGGTNQNFDGVGPFCWEMTVTWSDGSNTASVVLDKVRLRCDTIDESGDVVTLKISFKNVGSVVVS